MACENGHSKIAEMLVKKSAELNINLNAKHRLFGIPAFHLACENGYFIKLLISSSVGNSLRTPNQFCLCQIFRLTGNVL